MKDYLVEIGWRLLGIAALILVVALMFGAVWLFLYLISLNMVVFYIFAGSCFLFLIGIICYWIYIFSREQISNIKTDVRIKRRNRERENQNEAL